MVYSFLLRSACNDLEHKAAYEELLSLTIFLLYIGRVLFINEFLSFIDFPCLYPLMCSPLRYYMINSKKGFNSTSPGIRLKVT